MDKNNNQSNIHNKYSNGSVILAILSMATLSSMVMLTMMFSIKSLNKTLAMEELQNNAQQTLSRENNKTILNYVLNPERLTDSTSSSSTILADGIEYTYRQYSSTKRDLNWPIPGFSLKSNYASTFINFKSQITMNIIQTPTLTTGISCIDVSNDTLNRIPERKYSLALDDQLIDSIHYEFNSDTGEIRKMSATSSRLIMDIDFGSNQTFSRADFAAVKTAGRTKLAVIFAVINSKNTSHSQENRLYVLFDEIVSYQNFTVPLSSNELINLTNEYVPTGNENGFVLTLNPGELVLSAITTVDHQIFFITQRLEFSAQIQKAAYKNKLYLIDLASENNQIIQTRLLPESTQLLELTTHLSDQSQILIGTQINPALLTSPVSCRQVFQYEE